ncbi:restriction endonuclease subunit S [Klebsiella michiganensis]|uniref:restriction endonuclease subunit S n=1 Tax=Klebsiella michiganensis TaxID=1134687 RepID=UPI0039820128
MKVKTKICNVPKLRFPEFRDTKEWQEKQLHSICQMKAGKFISASKINIQPLEGLHPCYGGNGLRGFTHEYSHSGEYSLIGRQGALCGNVTFANGRFYATEHAVVVYPNKKVSNKWLFYCLNNLNLNQYAIGQAQPGLAVNFLEKIVIQIPEQEKEQQKIAECLSSLDSIISLQMQKIDALQQYKKGLMQNLFPSEGETAPELRFDGISDIAVRNEANLSSICYMKAGKFISASEINTQFAEGLYPCYGGNGLRGFTKVFSHNGGFSIIGRQGALCGNVIFADGDFYATEHAIVVTPKKKINKKWLFYCLTHLNLNQYATGQAQPGLSVNVLEKIVVNYPVKEKEQQKIAECLSSLDELITLEIQKLAALKTHKTGLMQQLFPSMDEVNA